MELATALIWTLRILLPVILFCIYFKLQSPKDEGFSSNSGPTTHVYPKGLLLARRDATVGSPAPEEIADITLKTQDQAPALFAPGRGGRAQRGGGEGGGRSRGERAERGERGDREKRPDKRDREKDSEVKDGNAEEAPAPVVVDANEEKMHVESLLNYVAFNRREQQRVFLPDVSAGAPPPPPPRTAKGAQVEGVTGATAEKANSEVQMVLRGAMKFKRAEVATVLFEMLADKEVEISESTFTLIIEACVLARELKLASDFLMKMEFAGFVPAAELLDKVMDLYSQEKLQREQQKKEQAEADVSMIDHSDGLQQLLLTDEFLPEGMRAKLSSSAPAFVPSFGDSQSKLSTEAAPFIPIGPPAVTEASPTEGEAPRADDGQQAGAQRTKLQVSAKLFTPMFVPSFDAGFDPGFGAAYTWPTGDEGEWGAWEGEAEADPARKGKGHGKGKGKDNAKGKDGSKQEDHSRKGKGKGKERSNGEDETKEKAKAKAKAKVKEGPQKEVGQEKDSGAKAAGQAKKWKAKASDE